MTVNFAETSLTRIIAGTGCNFSYVRYSHAFRNFYRCVKLNMKNKIQLLMFVSLIFSMLKKNAEK